MRRWNQPIEEGETDKATLRSASARQWHTVEEALVRVALELMEWVEKNDLQKAAVEASTGSIGKSKKP